MLFRQAVEAATTQESRSVSSDLEFQKLVNEVVRPRKLTKNATSTIDDADSDPPWNPLELSI